jgi:hypothetical protein
MTEGICLDPLLHVRVQPVKHTVNMLQKSKIREGFVIYLEVHDEAFLGCHVTRVRTRVREALAAVGALKRLLSRVDANVLLRQTYNNAVNFILLPFKLNVSL